jgi:hypothetical protein
MQKRFRARGRPPRSYRLPLLADGLTAFLPQPSSLAHSAPHNTTLDTNKPAANTNAPVSNETTAPTKVANIAKKSTGHSTLLADACTAPTILKSTAFAFLLRRARSLRARRLLRVCRLPMLMVVSPRHARGVGSGRSAVRWRRLAREPVRIAHHFAYLPGPRSDCHRSDVLPTSECAAQGDCPPPKLSHLPS